VGKVGEGVGKEGEAGKKGVHIHVMHVWYLCCRELGQGIGEMVSQPPSADIPW
jgi:hypothetical protein